MKFRVQVAELGLNPDLPMAKPSLGEEAGVLGLGEAVGRAVSREMGCCELYFRLGGGVFEEARVRRTETGQEVLQLSREDVVRMWSRVGAVSMDRRYLPSSHERE